jgi:hypothetical protein
VAGKQECGSGRAEQTELGKQPVSSFCNGGGALQDMYCGLSYKISSAARATQRGWKTRALEQAER